MEFDTHCQPVSMAEEGTTIKTGEKCTISGWENTGYINNKVMPLKVVSAYGLSWPECEKKIKFLTNYMMCASKSETSCGVIMHVLYIIY